MADNDKTLEQLQVIRSTLAGDTLPPSFAKLYSQYTRLRMNQPGLKNWRSDEFSARLVDAVTLIDLGLTERELGGEGWRNSLQRAGELLEWLSHPDLNIHQLPLRLLSAGVYQLAGYPALSLGLLNSESLDSNESQILTSFLKADFPHLQALTVNYWNKKLAEGRSAGLSFRDIGSFDVTSRLVDEVVKALGILCTYMRWGDTDRLERAQKKLHDMSEVMIYGTDNYSWLLSKIVSEIVSEYISNSMRTYVQRLQNGVSEYGKQAFERYLRSNYRVRKSLAWYSQARGIERLLKEGSFALCTPTGSGKTTIAEIAIIQSMYQNIDQDLFLGVSPIVMYLVPTRALATEVESKLGTVLGNLGSHSVKVTGLYGGIDWGPTDAWVTSTEPTVLICTYEKAEALIRFLGPLFLSRVSLIVIDEAHSVQFNVKNYENLRSGDDRSLRLEILANRLLRYIGERRIIALSAVAEENESLAHWVSGDEKSTPVVSTYRSTRQLIGRIQWFQSGEYEIHYDILNGHDLRFGDDEDNVPYVQKPFSPFPVPYQSLPKKYTTKKINKRQRPYLFWAVLQLVQPDEKGNQHSVLISVTQGIGGYAEDFLYVLNTTLAGQDVPQYFTPPVDPQHQVLFNKCLDACEDYFGRDSYEYQLLEKGIVVHHGNMPGLLARLLLELVQQRIVYIVLATSTLSEGVNLPFETVIIPTLIRNQERLTVSEFKNLVGRAGRPGSGTEGRTLVFLESRPREYSSRIALQNYNSLIAALSQAEQILVERNNTLSPLGALMIYIQSLWSEVSGSDSPSMFIQWLEKTIPLSESVDGVQRTSEEALDSLDGYLLSVIVEQELMTDDQLNEAEIEAHLINVWRRTYARYVMDEIELWEKAFSVRGSAIQKNIYPDTSVRRRLYRTSVAPRFGKRILDGYRAVKDHLETGKNYSEWPYEERLKYIVQTVEQISNLGKFEIPESHGSGKNPPTRDEILQWWLSPGRAIRVPQKNQVSEWVKFVKRNIEYKFNWGLGTVLSLILDDTNGGTLQETSIEDWPKTGLPWVVFWLKELIIWGTLDPVAALLLAHGIEFTRSAAETRALEYYTTTAEIPVEEVLNPTRIKEWADQTNGTKHSLSTDSRSLVVNVSLIRDFSKSKVNKWRVMPIISDDSVTWVDPAGYEFARSELPLEWSQNMESTHDFILNSKLRTIISSRFL